MNDNLSTVYKTSLNQSNNQSNQSDQRINIFSLQKENYSLRCRIEELTKENEILREKLQNYDHYKNDALFESKNKIDQLTALLDRAKIEKSNDDKYLREFISKAKGDNDKIKSLQFQIESLNEEIIKLNNKISLYQNREIDLKNEIEKFTILKNKYDSISNVVECLKKENSKLKKNLQLFANENHFAAIKIKDLENQISLQNTKETLKNMKNEEELNLIIAALIDKINNLKLQIKNKQELNNFNIS